MRIAVISAHNNASLAFVRSLARAGHEIVLVGLAGRANFAFRSRYAREKHLVPDPSEDTGAFLRSLEDIDFDAAVPCSEPTALALAGHPRAIMAPGPVFTGLVDKLRVSQRAREFGIKTPLSAAYEGSGQEFNGFVREHWPVFLKSRFSHIPRGKGMKKGKRWRPRSREDALETARAHARLMPMAQERVRGQAWGLSLLMWKGQCRAAFAHRRIREVPWHGGPSCAAVSVPVPKETLKRLEAWLADEGFFGLAMAEFKGDHLLEVNPRPWGSLPLAIMAGVDFPRLLVEAWSGEPGRGLPGYRVGLRAHHLKGELGHLRSLGSLGPVLRSLPGTIRPWPFFNLRRDDPAPALWEIGLAIRGGL